jgi:hypothetical protein
MRAIGQVLGSTLPTRRGDAITRRCPSEVHLGEPGARPGMHQRAIEAAGLPAYRSSCSSRARATAWVRLAAPSWSRRWLTCFGGVQRHHLLLGDLPLRRARSQQPQHLQLPLARRLDQPRHRAAPAWPGGSHPCSLERVGQPTEVVGRQLADQRTTRPGRQQRAEQGGQGRALVDEHAQVALGPTRASASARASSAPRSSPLSARASACSARKTSNRTTLIGA